MYIRSPVICYIFFPYRGQNNWTKQNELVIEDFAGWLIVLQMTRYVVPDRCTSRFGPPGPNPDGCVYMEDFTPLTNGVISFSRLSYM